MKKIPERSQEHKTNRRSFLGLMAAGIAFAIPFFARSEDRLGYTETSAEESRTRCETQGQASPLRQVFIDTETTGLNPCGGDRLIEIGCVEALDGRLTGRCLHYYLDPGDKQVGEGIASVHGISNEFLRGMPMFYEIADELIAFLADAQVLAHNARFDADFLDNELRISEKVPSLAAYCLGVVDTLDIARNLHPGERVSLAALGSRYRIETPGHSSKYQTLRDAARLALVYFAMTSTDAPSTPYS